VRDKNVYIKALGLIITGTLKNGENSARREES